MGKLFVEADVAAFLGTFSALARIDNAIVS
jgi:hypothetical protein